MASYSSDVYLQWPTGVHDGDSQGCWNFILWS